MRFWDSSGVLPLLVEEVRSVEMKSLLLPDPDVVVWWGTELECWSAVARRDRGRESTAAQVAAGLRRLAEMRMAWQEVAPSQNVRDIALGLVAAYELRAADALQLAAASIAAGSARGSLPFVTLDRRLRAAAEREGFIVQPAA